MGSLTTFLTIVLSLILVLIFFDFLASPTEGTSAIVGPNWHMEYDIKEESPFPKEKLNPPLKYIEVLPSPKTVVPPEPEEKASLVKRWMEMFAWDRQGLSLLDGGQESSSLWDGLWKNSSQLAGFFFDSSNTKVAELVPAIDAYLTAKKLGRMQQIKINKDTIRYVKAFKHQVDYKGGYARFEVGVEKAPAMPESAAGKLYCRVYEYVRPTAKSENDDRLLAQYLLSKMVMLQGISGEEVSGYWFQGTLEEVVYLIAGINDYYNEVGMLEVPLPRATGAPFLGEICFYRDFRRDEIMGMVEVPPPVAP